MVNRCYWYKVRLLSVITKLGFMYISTGKAYCLSVCFLDAGIIIIMGSYSSLNFYIPTCRYLHAYVNLL